MTLLCICWEAETESLDSSPPVDLAERTQFVTAKRILQRLGNWNTHFIIVCQNLIGLYSWISYFFLVFIDQSIASTKIKYIKLKTKTQILFLITFDFCIHFKEKTFFSFCFLVKVYKKVVKFSFKRQKIFWVLVFGFMYLVLVDAMD